MAIWVPFVTLQPYGANCHVQTQYAAQIILQHLELVSATKPFYRIAPLMFFIGEEGRAAFLYS